MMTDNALDELAGAVIDAATNSGHMVTTAESCTGGMVAAALTGIAGASAVLDRGFVTYSNAAKTDLLGVPESVLRAHGAVSSQTAACMADGALVATTNAHLAIAITGIAGPGGGSANLYNCSSPELRGELEEEEQSRARQNPGAARVKCLTHFPAFFC